MRGKVGIKTTTSPQICCCTSDYLVKSKWLTIQPYSTVNSVQSDEKTFNYGKCSQRMLFLCFSTQINLRHVFNFGTCVFWVVNTTGQWMRQMCVVQCCVKRFLHNWKEWAMQHTWPICAESAIKLQPTNQPYLLYDFWCAQTCSFQAIFGLHMRNLTIIFYKIGRSASTEVALNLRNKCLPVLLGLYWVESCLYRF